MLAFSTSIWVVIGLSGIWATPLAEDYKEEDPRIVHGQVSKLIGWVLYLEMTHRMFECIEQKSHDALHRPCALFSMDKFLSKCRPLL